MRSLWIAALERFADSLVTNRVFRLVHGPDTSVSDVSDGTFYGILSEKMFSPAKSTFKSRSYAPILGHLHTSPSLHVDPNPHGWIFFFFRKSHDSVIIVIR